MRGTSIFALPGALISAALGDKQSEKKHKDGSVFWRVRREFFYWRMHRLGDQAIKDFKAGKCRILTNKHLESLENYLNLQ